MKYKMQQKYFTCNLIGFVLFMTFRKRNIKKVFDETTGKEE